MRKVSSSQLVKTYNPILFLVKVINAKQKMAFVILLVLFVSTNVFSQTLSKAQQSSEKYYTQVVKVDDYLNSLKAQSEKSTANKTYNNLLSLLKDLKPTVYFKKGIVNSYGATPICLRSDVASINLASNGKISYSNLDNAEIVTISIDNPKELDAPINLSFISNLKKVKYIYLLLSFEVSPEILSNSIKNVKPDFVVLYNIDNRS